MAVEVTGEKNKVSGILQFVNKNYPLNAIEISANDQAEIRIKQHIDDSTHVCYGKYKLPENPTNDLVHQRHPVELPEPRQDVVNLSHCKRICNKDGKVFVLITSASAFDTQSLTELEAIFKVDPGTLRDYTIKVRLPS